MKKLLLILFILPCLLFAQSWQVLPNSPVASFHNFDDVAFINEEIGWICAISGEIYKTTDGGDSWTLMVNMPGTSFRAMAWIDDQNGFVGTLGPGSWVQSTTDPTIMYKTNDGGVTWVDAGIPETSSIKGICGMQVIDSLNIVGVGRYDGPAVFIKSDDGGLTWIQKSVPAESLVDVHFFDTDTGLVCGRGGAWRAQMYYTTNGGDDWELVSQEQGDHYWKVFFLDRMNGYAQRSNYSFNTQYYTKTSDGGLTWDQVSYMTPSGEIYEGLGIGFFTEQWGWACGDDESYETTDGGITFTQMSFDPNDGDIVNRIIRVSDSVMFAAGNRVYKFSYFPVGESEIPEIDYSKCKISCNPNPFSGIAKITYVVPEDDHVSIAITSIGGRIIEILVDKEQKAGTYTISYEPKYNQKFVSCTILTGRYRKNIKIIRPGGGNFRTDY